MPVCSTHAAINYTNNTVLSLRARALLCEWVGWWISWTLDWSAWRTDNLMKKVCCLRIMWGLSGNQGVAYNLSKPLLLTVYTMKYHMCLDGNNINSKGSKVSVLINLN